MRLHKKLAIAAVGTVAAISVATGAFAYWTAGGAGGGSGSAADSNGSVLITASVPNGIVPGGSVDVPVNAKTSAGTDLFITGFDAPVITVSNAYDADDNPGGCKASDFHFNMVGVHGGTVAHGTTATSLGTGVLSFDNDLVNSQDGCKSATVSVALTSN